MTSEEVLLEQKQDEKKLRQIQKQIPGDRYEWELTASPAERHRRRAEEVTNLDLKQLHLDQAKQMEEQELLFAKQITDLEDQVVLSQAEEEDRLFQLALKKGPTRWTKVKWSLIDNTTTIVGLFQTYAKPILKEAYNLSWLWLILSIVGTAFYGTNYCLSMGLGLHWIAGALLLIPLTIFGIISESKPVWVTLTLLTLGFLGITTQWQVIRPSNDYVGLETTNNEVTKVIGNSFFMSSPSKAKPILWYYKGGRLSASDKTSGGTPTHRTIINGQKGTFTVTAHTQLREEVLSGNLIQINDSSSYRDDIRAKFKSIIDDLRAKGIQKVPIELNEYLAQLKAISNDMYIVTDVNIEFAPDSIVQELPKISLK